MIRTVHRIYKVLLDCLPKDWEAKPPLIWYWDGMEMMRQVNGHNDLDTSDGFSDMDTLMVTVGEGEDSVIHATMTLAERPIANIVLDLLHEIAHANGIDDECEADDEALRVFRTLNRKARWKELGLKLRLVRRRKDQTATPADRVDCRPVRLGLYQPPWEKERY